ncbi:MAG: SPOR domain-containing protein [Saprospiraceae bacterium]|nr:SPOR domain-containing protein [Saprospiraceae bacterium]
MNIPSAISRSCFLYKLILTCVWLLMAIPPGDAQMVEEPRITALMDRWITYNAEHQELRGWRIQIMASIDRRQMETARRVFEKRYPEYPVIFIHNEPYFHLKVGAFTTMQKAQAFLKKMQQDYPQAIPVTDNLRVEELLLYDQ